MDEDSTTTTQDNIDPIQGSTDIQGPLQATQDPKLVAPDSILDEDINQSTDTFVDLGEGSDMPPMLNLQTAGVRRSPRIVKLKRPRYKCNLTSRYVFVLTVATIFQWAPTLADVYSGSENMVFSAVHSYHAANQLFDDTLNSLHPMALST